MVCLPKFSLWLTKTDSLTLVLRNAENSFFCTTAKSSPLGTVGRYRWAGHSFFCTTAEFPTCLLHVSSLLGGLSVQEVAQLFDVFRGKPLTRAGVERALECSWQAPGQEVPEALGQKGPWLW